MEGNRRQEGEDRGGCKEGREGCGVGKGGCGEGKEGVVGEVYEVEGGVGRG